VNKELEGFRKEEVLAQFEAQIRYPGQSRVTT
jgi:hypothetical protein